MRKSEATAAFEEMKRWAEDAPPWKLRARVWWLRRQAARRGPDELERARLVAAEYVLARRRRPT